MEAILCVPSIEAGTLVREQVSLNHLTLKPQAPDPLLLLLLLGICSK